MSGNKKRFFVSAICSGIMFSIGVLYIIIPAYYGINFVTKINTNDLFISVMLIFAVINFVKYTLLGKNPNNENIYICITSCFSGILNLILNNYFNDSIALAMSLAIFVLLITGIKLFTIDYYHDRKDAYYYIEGLLLAIFFVVGIITSLNLFSDMLLQTIMLGYFILIMSILDIVNISIKTMLKAKRFLKKIKLD